MVIMRQTERAPIVLLAGVFAVAAPAVGWAQEGPGNGVDAVMMSVVKDSDGTEQDFANEITVPARASEGDDDSSGNSNAGGETRGIERALEVGPGRSDRATRVLEALQDRAGVPEEVRGIGRELGKGKPQGTPGKGPK